LLVDSVGKETPKKFPEWMWIGVYGEKKDGHDNLIYYKRHKIHDGKQQIKVLVKEKPKKAGIDPKTFLIDRKRGKCGVGL
jgi:ABC-2 type transport system permease protein